MTTAAPTTMRDTFIATLHEVAKADPRVLLITGDLGFGVLTEFAETVPESYLNCGVAEQNMTLIATGCALSGRVVYTYSIANFPTLRCLEMLRNDVAYHEAAVVVVAVGGGYSYGNLGMSHHATEDLAIMRAIPGMTVVAPGDLLEVREAALALHAAEAPGYLRVDKAWADDPESADVPFELGKARVVREGTGLTVISTGGILGEVVPAVDALRSQGHSIRVLSMHTIKPLDHIAIQAAATETGGIVTVEEHVATGGLGSAVAESFADAGVWPGSFERIALPADEWAPVGTQDHLRRLAGLDRDSLHAAFERHL